MIEQPLKSVLLAGVLALLGACASAPQPPTPAAACPAALSCPACPVCPAPAAPAPPEAKVLEPVGYEALPGWREDDLAGVLGALRRSCQALRIQPSWRDACAGAERLDADARAELRRYFEEHFVPYRVATPEGETRGLVTGYYEPLLRGSRARQGPYRFPLYAPPDDLLVIDLAAINPDLRHLRLRGRLDGRRVVPYWSRAEIERGAAPLAGKEIAWVDDAIEAFFLQIQGSGRVRLEDGELLRVGYADQNGHPYHSIGRYLVERGEIALAQASMDGIKAWARANPARLGELLNANPSYVFFRELPKAEVRAESTSLDDAGSGPLGALGVPLTPWRSIAVDPRYIPLGAPVFLATTWPDSHAPLARLVLAQDTGGAIRGALRADFFWGFGEEAGSLAGRMRQQGSLWVLLPRGAAPAH